MLCNAFFPLPCYNISKEKRPPQDESVKLFAARKNVLCFSRIMKLLKLIYYRFSNMHPSAVSLLKICLFIILSILSLTYVYLDTSPRSELFWLWCRLPYITECILSSVLCSFVGAFLVDYASVSDK